MLKAKEICNRVAYGVPCTMVISYIFNKGEIIIGKITDDDISSVEGNDLLSADLMKKIMTAAREIVKKCDQNDIVRLIKSEWCCAGEVYDPDLDQFVTDTSIYEDEEEY